MYRRTSLALAPAGPRLVVVAVDRPVAGNRNDCTAWKISDAKDAVDRTTVIADAATAAPAWSSRTATNAARKPAGSARLQVENGRPHSAGLDLAIFLISRRSGRANVL
ncbi:hypothetical protein GCM10019016_104360 [Streptomyces prasinosporus]|uniref:Uncharacterized protein n=1 Tax=Streptomyces prasinosporus TaxID=68256 RepID=A0ABP6UA31_9ACTN